MSYQSDPSLDDDEGRLSSDVDDEGRCNDGGESGRVETVAAMGLLGAGVAQSVSQLHVVRVCIIVCALQCDCTIIDIALVKQPQTNIMRFKLSYFTLTGIGRRKRSLGRGNSNEHSRCR